MTSEQFKAWRLAHYPSQQAAADALGLSRATINNYEIGRRREDDRAVEIPRVVELACAAAEAERRGYEAGQRDMRTRAAGLCDLKATASEGARSELMQPAYEECARDIRALTIDVLPPRPAELVRAGQIVR